MRKLLSFILSFSFVFALSNSDVIVNYYMDECLWGKVIDFSGNGYFAEPQNDANTTAGGVINNDGNLTVSNYLISDNAITVEGNYTIKLWVKWPLGEEGHTDYGRGQEKVYFFNLADIQGSDSDFIYFEKDIENETDWYICVKNGSYCKKFTPPADGWHMFTFVADEEDTQTSFYIDKTLQTQINNYVSGDLAYIGTSDYNDDENGQTIGAYIDEFIIFNKALSQDEIEEVYDNENTGKNFDGSERQQYFLCSDTNPECDLNNGLYLFTYDISSSSIHYPYNHEDYDTLENDYAKVEYEYGNGFVDNIDTTGSDNNPYHEDPDDKYLSIFNGYIYIPEAGTYSFAVNGDDAVEVDFGDNNDVYYGWYGGHAADSTDHHFSMSFGKSGYYKLKFRHQDWTGRDSYQLYWKKPGDSDYSIVPKENLFYCELPEAVANYRMDECFWDGSNGDVKDSSVNHNDLTSYGGANTFTYGKVLRAGSFNGTDSKVIGTWDQPFDKQVSLTAWFKTDKIQNWYTRIVEFSDDGYYQHGTALAFDKNGKIIRGWTANSSGVRSEEVTYDLYSNGYFDNNWHQVVFTYDNGFSKLYIDGKEVDSSYKDIGEITDAKTLAIGGYYPDNKHNFNGDLDEVKVFNKALTQDNVSDIYIREKDGFDYKGSIRPPILCVPDNPDCDKKNGIELSTYDISSYSKRYPQDHLQYDDLENDYAKDNYLFGSGVLDSINTTGSNNNPYHIDPDDKYLSVFTGYIYIPEPGIYSFAVNGDDAVEVLLYSDRDVYYGWYGAHSADSTDHNFEVDIERAGYYKIKFRHQDWTGADSYQLYWKKPGDSDYSIVPKAYLFYCNKEFIFDAWDTDENITTKYIKTKLVNKEFNLTVVSLDANNSEKADFNGTVCVRVVSNDYNSSWQKLFFENENEKNETFMIDRAIKNAKVNIVSLADENVSCPINSDDANESNSTDNFAIRPEKFVITNIPSNIKAGNEFNITVQAVDVNGNPVKDYNESIYINGQSVDLEYNETKLNCKTGILKKISGGVFKDGEANITLKYNEVGDLNLTVKEINGSEFAVVDSDDTNETDRVVLQTNSTVDTVVDHFDLNAKYENYDIDTNFTYYDEDLNISSHLELNISAVDKDGNILQNYNKECYAKDITVNLSHNDVDVNVSRIIYKYIDKKANVFDNNISKDENITFIYDRDNFTTDNNGSTSVDVYLNFDRNVSSPVNPFEFEIKSIDVNDSDANGSLDLNKKAKYYYGNLLLDDVLASENDFNKSYYFIVFDSVGNLKPDGKEVVYNWYENTAHNSTDGNVSDGEIVISGDYNASNTINGVNVSVDSINNGVITFKISRTDSSVKFAVVHLLSPNLKWLWYSKFNQKYDISNDSTCLNHFCFTITWQNLNNDGEVGSGTFNGTEVNVSDTNSTKRGVKIFR